MEVREAVGVVATNGIPELNDTIVEIITNLEGHLVANVRDRAPRLSPLVVSTGLEDHRMSALLSDGYDMGVHASPLSAGDSAVVRRFRDEVALKVKHLDA